MNILLVGSLPDGGSNLAFQNSCKQLGRQVAERKWKLIVGGNSETDPDHWALDGANEIGCDILLYPPENAAEGWSSNAPQALHPGAAALLEEVSRQYPKLRPALLPPPPGSWNIGYAQAVAYADVVVLIGGKDGTRFVGQLATALLRPVVAIPCFGGSSEEEWVKQRARYDSLRERGKISSDIINDLRSLAPLRLSAAAVMLCEAIVRDRSSTFVSGYRITALLILTVVLVAIWTIVFIWPPPVEATIQRSVSPVAPIAVAKLAGLLWVSTSAGVIFRSVWRHLKKPEDLLLLSSVGMDLLLGFLTAFAYLLLCFAGHCGVATSWDVRFLSTSAWAAGFRPEATH
jgi:hypothetical protein